jgi:hypothetical protein
MTVTLLIGTGEIGTPNSSRGTSSTLTAVASAYKKRTGDLRQSWARLKSDSTPVRLSYKPCKSS